MARLTPRRSGLTSAPQTWQDHLRVEKKELDTKIRKLFYFMEGSGFDQVPPAERGRMQRQHSHMTAYSLVLGERIANFPSQGISFKEPTDES